MSRLVCFSTLLSILMLLFGCAGMGVPQHRLENDPVVHVHNLPGIEVNAVASIHYWKALQGAIERQDRDRMLSAGFTPEQADKLLDPAQSAAFLAPYQEAARGQLVAVRAGELCRVWIMGAHYRVKPQRPAEACAQL